MLFPCENATELSYRNLSQLFHCTCRKSMTAGAIVITRVIIHVEWREVTKNAITESRFEKRAATWTHRRRQIQLFLNSLKTNGPQFAERLVVYKSMKIVWVILQIHSRVISLRRMFLLLLNIICYPAAPKVPLSSGVLLSLNKSVLANENVFLQKNITSKTT